MLSTTTFSRGDIILVSFPFTDLTSTKRRPALVLSPDSFNALKQDLILAPITSKLVPDVHAIVLEDHDFKDGRLPKRSQVKLTKVFTIHSALVVKRICGLKPEKMNLVLESVRTFYS